MEAQLKLNLSRQVQADDGQKDVPVTTRIPKFIDDLIENTLAPHFGKKRSKLIAEYVIEAVCRDAGAIALTNLHSNDSLKTILARQ